MKALKCYVLTIMTFAFVASSARALPDLVGFGGVLIIDNEPVDASFDADGENLAWGDFIQLKFSVLNDGDQTAGQFSVEIYLSADTSFGDAGDYKLFDQPGIVIPAQQVYYLAIQEFPLPLSNPLSGTPTTIYVGMVIDPLDQIAEARDDNNKNQGAGIDYDGTPLTILDPVPDIHPSLASVDFGLIKDDGPGGATGTRTVTITNNGKANLTIAGIYTAGSSDFQIVDIVSTTQDVVPPMALPKPMLPRNLENWLISLSFDPESVGTASADLIITSDDPDEATLTIPLNGEGEPVADLTVVDSTAPANDYTVRFGNVTVDGSGGAASNHTVTLSNPGSGVLTVSQNGISLTGSGHYSLDTITSNTQGTIHLASDSATIAADGAEIWTIPISFDPTALGQFDIGLQIYSDDPDQPQTVVTLTGKGITPANITVTEASGTSNDDSLVFDSAHADGAGLDFEVVSFSIQNSGETPLAILQNGIKLSDATQFQILAIESDLNGAVDLSDSSVSLAPDSSESWTVSVRFDPLAQGNFNETITIESDDPDQSAYLVNLSGTGLLEPDLVIEDSSGEIGDRSVDFGAVLNDGTGGGSPFENRTGSATITLTNHGAADLIVSQNGITFSGNGATSIISVVSSVDGAVDLASSVPAVRTLSPAQVETWTINLEFDPQGTGAFAGSLTIASNDTDEAVANVALSGEGEIPQITLTNPPSGQTLNLMASAPWEIHWSDDYEAGNATISLYLSNDTDPASPKALLVNGLFEDNQSDHYLWQPSTQLLGGPYYLFATISDASVTVNSFSLGQILIEPEGAFQLLSPIHTTSSNYAYEYSYYGQTHSGVVQLNPGENSVTVTTPRADGGSATHTFEVKRVDSLLHRDGYTYDQLNRVQSFTNGNGITTTYHYDLMGRLDRTEASNGNTVDYEYDVLGRLIKMTDSTGTTFYDYDTLDRLTHIYYSEDATKGNDDDKVLEYQYYLNNRLQRIIYPNGETIRYEYDPAGRLAIVDNETLNLEFDYHYYPTTGQLHYFTRPNGIRTVYGYDSMGRIDLIRHERMDGSPIGSGAVVLQFDYELNNLGFAEWLTTTRESGAVEKEHYIYDDLDRLHIVIYSDDANLNPQSLDTNDLRQTYTYDNIGNRLTFLEELNGHTLKNYTYHYGNENRLLRVTDLDGDSVAEYGYDSAGNRTQKVNAEGTTIYTYNENGSMIGTITGNRFFTYRFNGQGHRVKCSNGASEVRYVIDPTTRVYKTLAIMDSQSTEVRVSYTFGHNLLLRYDLASNHQYHYLSDRLGSIRALADEYGIITKSTDYDVFGNLH